jgi:hypothetical protein
MKKIIIIICLAVCAGGCELFVIGTKKEPVVEVNQNSALGAVYLFKAELDSNNIRAATEIFANPGGQPILAIDKYEMFDELDRIRRLIGDKPITLVETDSLSLSTLEVNIEFDYLRTLKFTTAKISDNWYIINYYD